MKAIVEYAADLARIELKPEELERLSSQLQAILDFIDKLKKLDIEGVSPTSHVLPINNVFRDDVAAESLPIEKTLANAPQKEGNFFGVPAVID